MNLASLLALLVPLVAADPASWCHVKPGKCTGQRHSFKARTRLKLWEQVVNFRFQLLKGMRFGDWDADGDLDIIVADKEWAAKEWQLSVLEQLANGSFAGHPIAVAELDNFAVADWNADGRLDVLVCHEQNERVIVSWFELSQMASPEVILNTSRVLPKTAISELRGIGRTACGFNMQAIDFDRDGDLDLLLGDVDPRYFERISAGQVIERAGLNPIAGKIGKNASVRVEQVLDLDGDGLLDVLLRVNQRCSLHGCGADYLFLHQAADGTFIDPSENPFARITIREEEEYAEELQIVDWNSDGLLDILFVKIGQFKINPDFVEHVVLQTAQPHSQFNPFKYIDLRGEELHLADVDGDGHTDVVIAESECNGFVKMATWCSTTSSVDPLRLYLYEPGMNLKEVFGSFQNVTETRLGPFRIAIADWDLDGDSDLLVAAFDGRLHYHEMIGGAWQEESRATVFADITFPVLSGVVKNVSHYNHTSGTWYTQQHAEPRKHKVQPLAVDWDGDGDIDLVLGPEGWYWERLPDGTLLEYPLERSPFRNASSSDAAWRFVDCDGDGDLDLVRKSGSYEDHYLMKACEHDGRSLKCDSDFLCLGMNLSNLTAGKSIYSFDFADMAGDGQPELVSAQYDYNRLGVWSAGFCTPPDACHKKGLCQPDSEVCACISGHEFHDCSGCEPNFYTIPRAGLGQMHDCAACPGARGEVCHSRGFCFDDVRAKTLAISRTAALMATGNGSCSCSEAQFGGVDAAGRQTCVDGNCPAGTEETDGRCEPCHPGYMSTEGGTCRACAPGAFALQASSQCKSCPVGAVAEKAGSSACMDCPAGKHEAKRQFCSDCPPGTMSAAGSGSCVKCRAGFHAMSPGSSACEACAAGTFSEEGSLKCTSCSAGTISDEASEACSPCKAGQIARNSLTCEPCPGGTYALERSTFCRACPQGQVSGSESSTCQRCESVWFRVIPENGGERCKVSVLDFIFAGFSWICLACFFTLTFAGCHSKLTLEDLSLHGDKLVATTSLPHHFLRWEWATPEIYFTSTGVPDLDSNATTWKAKAQSADELTLLSEKAMDRPLDTSMGYLHVKFPMAFFVTGFAGFPLICWCLLFSVAAAANISLLRWRLVLVVWVLSLAMGTLNFCDWRRRGLRTALLKRRRQFRRDLPQGPVPCARGPQRSISAGQLQDFIQFFNGFIKERSMYYVCNNIVKPLTEPFQVSFVELVGPVNIQWFISHSWQMPVRHFSDSIFKHAQSCQTSWRDSAYWICTFSNSQWHVKEELGNGRWQQSSFYLALISPHCQGTAMIIDELVQPLQRIWCLFEVYQTICLSRNGHSQGLLLCTSTGVLQEGNAGTDVAVAVARKIANLDTRAAEATNEADRMMIHALIEQMPGGFDAMNAFVRETISDALKSSHVQYEKAFSELVHDLNGQPAPPASPPPLPTLLTTRAREEQHKD